MQAITDNIRRQIDIIVSKLHELLYNLVLAAETQHEVLYWISMCLYSNSKRAQVGIFVIMICDQVDTFVITICAEVNVV